MAKVCINCSSNNLKDIPAGVSKKTGKPYEAFTVCGDCNKGQNKYFKPKWGGKPREEAKSGSNDRFLAITEQLDRIEGLVIELQASLLDKSL